VKTNCRNTKPISIKRVAPNKPFSYPKTVFLEIELENSSRRVAIKIAVTAILWVGVEAILITAGLEYQVVKSGGADTYLR
jgi:hypothetical protein